MKFISMDLSLKILANDYGFVLYNLHINRIILGEGLVLTKENTPTFVKRKEYFLRV